MDTIEISTNWQLFLDDHIVDRISGLSRVVHQPNKCGIVLDADKPWESFGCGGANVYRDDSGRWHMLYGALFWDPSVADELPANKIDKAHYLRSNVAYAVSEDGIEWIKPELNITEAPAGVSYDNELPNPSGSTTKNNCGVPFGWFCDLANHGNISNPNKSLIIRIVHSDSKHIISSVNLKPNEESFYFAKNWPDFFNDSNWKSRLKRIEGARSCPRGFRQIFGYDTINEQWLVFAQGHWKPSRNIIRYVSKDMKSWIGQSVLAPGSEDSHTVDRYNEFNSITVFRCEDFWLGFLEVFHGDRSDKRYLAPGLDSAWRKGTIETQLVISKDAGANWTRVANRRVWLPHGAEEKSIDRLIFPGKPVRYGEEAWFYCTVNSGDHLQFLNDKKQTAYHDNKSPQRRILLAKQRWNGYVSITAGREPRVLVTKPVVFEKTNLYINANALNGAIKVEIVNAQEGGPADPDGHWVEPIEGFANQDCRTINGTGICQKVLWKEKIFGELTGKPVRIRFTIQNADLFGFRIDD